MTLVRQLPQEIVGHVFSFLIPRCIYDDQQGFETLQLVAENIWKYNLASDLTCRLVECACLTHKRVAPHFQAYYETHRRAVITGRNFHITFSTKLARAQYLRAYEKLHGCQSGDPDLCQPNVCCLSSISHTSSHLINLLQNARIRDI